MFVRADNNNNIIVVPKSLRNDVLKRLHDDFGHPGIKKTLSRVKERYFWHSLTKFVKHYCACCHFCAINKDNKAPNNAPLLPISTHNLEPFEKVAIDILDPLPVAKDGSKYLLVLQDYFTKWPETIALKSVDLNNVQNWLRNEIIPCYGATSELITDQGVQFISQSFQNYCKSVGIKNKTDCMVEKFNHTFLNMIRNYISECQDDWSTHIPLIVYAYRTAVNDTIGISPAEA